MSTSQLILTIILWRKNFYSPSSAKQTGKKKSQINCSGHRARSAGTEIQTEIQQKSIYTAYILKAKLNKSNLKILKT